MKLRGIELLLAGARILGNCQIQLSCLRMFLRLIVLQENLQKHGRYTYVALTKLSGYNITRLR